MDKFYKRHIHLIITITFAVMMIGCNSIPSVDSDMRMNVQIGQNGRIAKLYGTYSGVERSTQEVESGQSIHFYYAASVLEGSLALKWLDPSGTVVWQRVLSENASGTEEIASESPGRYTIIVQGQRTVGSFNIAWNGELAGFTRE